MVNLILSPFLSVGSLHIVAVALHCARWPRHRVESTASRCWRGGYNGGPGCCKMYEDAATATRVVTTNMPLMGLVLHTSTLLDLFAWHKQDHLQECRNIIGIVHVGDASIQWNCDRWWLVYVKEVQSHTYKDTTSGRIIAVGCSHSL